MSIYVHQTDVLADEGKGCLEGLLIGSQHGAVQGFCLGVAVYDQVEYNPPGVHDDQEGFYVLEGRGMACVGAEDFEIRPGSAFIAAKGVPHSMKRHPDSGPIRVLYAHGAV